MTKQIKLFFIFIAVGAVISVFSFFDVFGGVRSANFSDAIKPLPPLEDDTDHDGLTNAEESYWNTDFQNSDTDSDGYLDGEEVAAGHDPTIPSPDDKLLSNNLTEALSNLTLSGLVEGSLKPSNPNFNKSVYLVIDEILLKSNQQPQNTSLEPRTVDETPENIKKYATEILPYIKLILKEEGGRINKLFLIIENIDFFSTDDSTQDDDRYINLLKFLDTELPKLQTHITFLKGADVPKNLEKNHRLLIDLLTKLSNDYSSLRGSRQDPIRAAISLNSIINIFIDDVPNLLDNYTSQANR